MSQECEGNSVVQENVDTDRVEKENMTNVFENASKEELINLFSLDTNQYLRCKWTEFLENVPQNVVVIKTYDEYKKKIPPVRRKILDGEFYLHSGQPIPTPQMFGRRT